MTLPRATSKHVVFADPVINPFLSINFHAVKQDTATGVELVHVMAGMIRPYPSKSVDRRHKKLFTRRSPLGTTCSQRQEPFLCTKDKNDQAMKAVQEVMKLVSSEAQSSQGQRLREESRKQLIRVLANVESQNENGVSCLVRLLRGTCMLWISGG